MSVMDIAEIGSTNQHASPWPSWAASLVPRNLERKADLFHHFSLWLGKNAQWLWVGEKRIDLIPATQLALREKLLESAKTAHDEVVLSDWWDRLIAAGNQAERWKISLLPPIARLPSEKIPFVRRDFQLLHFFRPVQQAFLAKTCSGLTDAALRDATLCSAVFFGGLLNAKYLTAFLTTKPSHSAVFGGRLSIALDGSPYGARLRRWYPDALTATLYIRALAVGQWEGGGEPVDDKIAASVLLNSAHRIGLPINAFAAADLMRAARVAHALAVPAYVAAYQAGDFESDSLPEEVMDHLCGHGADTSRSGAGSEILTHETIGRDISSRAPNLSYDPHVMAVDQIKVIREAKTILAHNRMPVEAMSRLLNKYSGSLWPITGALIEWAQWLLGHLPGGAGEYRRDSVRCVTVIRYLGAIARRLIEEAESEDVNSFDTEDFETLYELAAARVKRATERAVFWGRIRSFHDFLYLRGAPELLVGELDGYIGVGERRISANLVGESDFQTFKSAVKKSADGEDCLARNRLLVAAILGYRCGLRRREIQMLRAQDFFPGESPCLVVRPSKLAELKTYSARRRIPLHPLMPRDELQVIMGLASRRIDELAGQPGLLFADYATPTVPLSALHLFDPVTAAFSRLTNYSGPRFRFHHLRHSFANWLLLGLAATDEPRLIDRNLQLFDAFLLQPRQISVLRDAFYPRLPGTLPMPERRHVYLVSVLLGHLSPETTLGSYIHLMDWLAGQESELALERRIADHGSAALGNVCGLSPSMPFKKPYRDFLQKPVAFMRKFVSLKSEGLCAKKIEDIGSPIDLTAVFANLKQIVLPDPSKLFVALGCYCRKESIEKIVRTYVPEGQLVSHAYVTYRRMYAKQSVMTEKKLLPLPAFPRTKEDRKEFWRIVDATASAFANPDYRHEMILAAERLIARNGPRTGFVYLGEHPEYALDVVKGLIHMGLVPHVLKLNLRIPHNVQRVNPVAVEMAGKIQELGVVKEDLILSWPRRKMIGQLLRIEITNLNADSCRVPLREMTGRIRGVNYGALWVACAARQLEFKQ